MYNKSKMNLFWLFVVLCIFEKLEAFNFRQKLNKAISKAKAIYKNKFGKDKEWHFLGHDMSEYPGLDAAKRKIQEDKWSAYYSCLVKQENNIGVHGSIIPEAILAFEGESIKLECKVCLSPSETSDMESVEWEWSSATKEFLEPIDYGEHILLSPEDKTLHIYNLAVEHTGQYVCKLRHQLTAPYFLTVANMEEPLKMVHPKTAKIGPYAEIPWLINPEIILDTMHKHWSPCSDCNLVGKRHRYGYCIIIYLDNLEEPEDTDDDYVENPMPNTTNQVKYKEIKTNYVLSQTDRIFLQTFKYGLPCRSHILPDSMREMTEVLERESEITIGYCKVPCPVDEVFVVKDNTGHVIESANNTAGIYSMVQGFPSVEPPVERRLHFEAEGAEIILTCPGNLNTDTPIEWQIASKIVIPKLLAQESRGRLLVSITDKIYIKKARLTDTNIYSCWQGKELAGTIRVVIEKRINMNFNHSIMLIGIIVIVSVFLYVFVRAYFGRGYAKI